MARGRSLHSALDKLSGIPHHFLRDAVRAAAPQLSAASLDSAERTRKRADKAKHEYVFAPTQDRVAPLALCSPPRCVCADPLTDPPDCWEERWSEPVREVCYPLGPVDALPSPSDARHADAAREVSDPLVLEDAPPRTTETRHAVDEVCALFALSGDCHPLVLDDAPPSPSEARDADADRDVRVPPVFEDAPPRTTETRRAVAEGGDPASVPYPMPFQPTTCVEVLEAKVAMGSAPRPPPPVCGAPASREEAVPVPANTDNTDLKIDTTDADHVDFLLVEASIAALVRFGQATTHFEWHFAGMAGMVGHAPGPVYTSVAEQAYEQLALHDDEVNEADIPYDIQLVIDSMECLTFIEQGERCYLQLGSMD